MTAGTMRKTRLLVGNWKMYLGAAQSLELAKAIARGSKQFRSTSLWIAPSFPFLCHVRDALEDSEVRIGAQNVHWEPEGAFTGEVSARDLIDCSCHFAIVGHSERRSSFFETSTMVANRAKCSINAGLDTIICVGETFEQRQRKQTHAILHEQLQPVIGALSAGQMSKVCIAYEPVWAIGTGRYPNNEEIESAHGFIQQMFQQSFATAPCILYGGSATPDNFASILQVPAVHGALVGRASLKADQFLAMAEIAERVKN